MKKVAIIFFLLTISVSANTGWYSDYVIINKNSTGNSYYWIGSDPSFGTQLHGLNFGTVTSLVITGADMKYWSDNQDRTGGSFFWLVKSADGSTTIKSATENVWTQTFLGGNDYQGLWSGSDDILAGLSASTTYQLHVYAKSWGSSQGDSWLSNGGADYVATFTTDASLPVELTSFTALINNDKVQLNWQTATEVNNYGFSVERASTSLGMTWEKIAFVQGHGNSNSPKNYSLTDTPTGSTKFQYRLKQIDFDGKFEYSHIIEVELESPTNFSVQQNYPNPFNPETTISYTIAPLPTGEASVHVMLTVYDVLGREIATLVDEYKQHGNYQVTFNARHLERSREIPSGIYFYRLQAGDPSLHSGHGFVQTKKMLLIK
ncbi:MAG: hypothetical protein A2499_03000 [Stygiobacter sp. RIFOXYC12_FULL_38_8]|nr:MAG: hypothetical protein A2299_01580 [Stygiobacter sp. RIFOXYB2_FULL_37_11]OGV11519.1 MAG: hypothetical protein A2237_05555 [Stygiobacter sp. RIFOXYA2_FULL_38_8]OGV15041.1 MAG: hypothetical protein A2440_06740 [Stygiobacter sp. RIFOXYC2_FULL_38_25]OGV22080.1 MAG: hypothetical protein A2499_03000 [Stygiobacter sp. RIFOXYC12_FULL_38_8]OGV79616.1 MAG: hypothetical protein A2X65_18825 [Stygiobacter sp. GWF2_38_21]RJQ61379.1 MAG: T9SS C-terminal target domain-containing protein [Stygiobacter sp